MNELSNALLLMGIGIALLFVFGKQRSGHGHNGPRPKGMPPSKFTPSPPPKKCCPHCNKSL